MTAPLIVGLGGMALQPDEAAFLRAVRPAGIILFRRNISDREGVTRLVAEAVDASGAPFVFVDQEGGRVQRIRPPLVPLYPPAARIGALFAAEPKEGHRAAWLAGRLIAADLLPFGINAPCLPVADVPVAGAHDVIGDRAYATMPEAVALLARAAAAGVLAAGAVPVAKHMPGHGRAAADSHVSLPRVEADRAALEADFAPFRNLADMPMAMTAHVVYTALDPDRPATLSRAVIGVIREDIGFDGVLMTDDISMGALRGEIGANAAAALSAGCDLVLHCNGDRREMDAIASALPPMTPAAARRLEAARPRAAEPAEIALLREEFTTLTGQTA